MIFSIQRYLEDYFHRCDLKDTDQYAVTLATLYDRERHNSTELTFLAAMKRLRTAFFRRNGHIQRGVFEKKILVLLDGKFKKKEHSSSHKRSQQGLKLRASA